MQKKNNDMQSLFERAKSKNKPTIAISLPHEKSILQAVWQAKQLKLADFVLIGDRSKLEQIVDIDGLDINSLEIINQTDEIQACQTAVKLVLQGQASAVMKGLVHTSVFMRVALDKENGLRTTKLLSHLAVIQVASYHKLLFLTDAAINIAPDFLAKKQILKNAIQAIKNLGIDLPKIALLAAKEKIEPKMPLTLEYSDLVKQINDEYANQVLIDGPLALDNAVSMDSCKIKGIDSPVGGDADLLFCPDIEAGNILYKALNFLADAQSGGVVLGAKCPIILTSRADNIQSKLISIALSVLV